MQYTVTVGEDGARNVSAAELAALDVVFLSKNEYHIIRDGKAYRCELLHYSNADLKLDLKVNGRTFTVQIDGPLQQLVKQLGFATTAATADNDITAPMPGLILSIAVTEGDTIEAGTPLLVLEAMKMENVIKATAPGTVKAVHVTQGQAVDKRQLLIELA